MFKRVEGKQVQTQRGLVYVVAECSNEREAKENGFYYAFMYDETRFYSRSLDDRGLKHEFCICNPWNWPDEEQDRHTSATSGDYSPSNPWDAPGMSIHDFI